MTHSTDLISSSHLALSKVGHVLEYLNRQSLESIAAPGFQSQQPYPWIDIQNPLTRDGYQSLRETMPDLSCFDQQVGIKRGYGQAPHDRYLLHYRPGLDLAEPWKQFIAELQGEVYQSFLRRLLGPRTFIPTLEWYYAWRGCAVSPHCDAARKLATHIFYFNENDEWEHSWGGQILILDSHRRFTPHSAPGFDDLEVAAALEPLGNGSLLFQRTPHSWHGVRPIQCPEGKLRKLFIVTVNVPSFQVWWRRMRGKDPDGFRIHA